MTDGETPGRSMARAHLSQLVEMFGTDGWLRISTTSDPGPGGSAPEVVPDADEPEGDEQT
ncbi:hypothetical protein [Streptomyces sp. NPDC059597]|uniref:hypothetical protein n=1 Tax=Streptomyces sp. NPDC059597 TaxID=3346879 RepID=UPI0036C3591B